MPLLYTVQPQLSYSQEFLNGAKFRIFQTHTNGAKIGTYEHFGLKLPESFSHMASFRLLHVGHTRCPCKYGRCVSWP